MEDLPIDEALTVPVRWITIDAAEAGMVLARPVVAARQGTLLLTLAAGVTLTADLLVQLIVRGVECVGVEGDPQADPEAERVRREQRYRRIEAIFGAAYDDLDAERRALFDALLAGGS